MMMICTTKVLLSLAIYIANLSKVWMPSRQLTSFSNNRDLPLTRKINPFIGTQDHRTIPPLSTTNLQVQIYLALRVVEAGKTSLIQERTILLGKVRSRRKHAYSAKRALTMGLSHKREETVENFLIQTTCFTQAVEEYKRLWNTMLRLPSKRYSTPTC